MAKPDTLTPTVEEIVSCGSLFPVHMLIGLIQISILSDGSTNTCSNPSLSQVYYGAFNAENVFHFLHIWVNLAQCINCNR